MRDLAAGQGVRLLCGRYEGVDQRLLDARGAEEVSIGDYVLSGGELPALVLLDACVRLLPGVMGAAPVDVAPERPRDLLARSVLRSRWRRRRAAETPVLSSRQTLPPIHERRRAGVPLEQPGEVARVVIADARGHLGDG